MIKTKESPDILVGIITYKRPKMLASLLDSLTRQTILITDISVEVIIVDNDITQSAKKVFEQHLDQIACNMQYLNEIKKGIPYARNKILEYALEKEAKYIAFIDDDEVALPEWLITMYQIITSKNVDAVQGPVIDLLPDDSPPWAIKEANKRSKTKEGEYKRGLATGNVIFSSKLIREKRLRFDTNFAMSGGSDIDFFERAADLGSQHICTQKELVYQKIPSSRLTLTWELQRSFRVGAAGTFISLKQKGLFLTIRRYILKIITRLFFSPILLFTAGILSSSMRLLAVRWFGSSIGHFLGFFKILGTEYSQIHGN